MFKRIFIVLILFLGLFFAFSSAFAAWELEIDWPPSPMGTDLTTTSTLTELSKYLYEWGIALGGLAAFIALLIAGFLYLTSVGDPQKLADARGRIIWALAGLVLLFAAWLILDTINPDLTRPHLEELLPGCDASSTIDTAVTPCPGGQTCCKPGFICIDDPNPGDGTKEGICMSSFIAATLFYLAEEGPSCRYARVFAEENFDYTGTNNIANFDENTAVGHWSTTDTRSIKSLYDDGGECATSAPRGVCEAVIDSAGNRLCDWNPDATTTFNTNCFRDCGPDACGCRAELYDMWKAEPDPCKETLGHISAYEKNLVKYSGEDTSLFLQPIYGDGDVDCVVLRGRLF